MDNTIRQLVNRFKTTDPFIIAEGLNILIRYADLEEGTRGLYFRKLRRRFIVIHRGLDEHWQKIVCAHELGHDRLHPGLSRFWLDEQSFFNTGKYERQANTFALKLVTYNIDQEVGETSEQYLFRCGVPKELHMLYM